MEATGPAMPIAAVACVHCRRLKMKCIGSGTPPCARCAKAGRECIVQKPGRTQLSGTSSGHHPDASRNFANSNAEHGSDVPDNGGLNQVWRYGAAVDRNLFRVNQEPGEPSEKESALPSIYTTTPYTTVFRSSESTLEDPARQCGLKRRRNDNPSQTHGPLSGTYGSYNAADVASIPERDMIQLIDIFRMRMLFFIPLIDQSDLEDIPHVISEKRTLALCICYVTTRYIPGGDRTRAQLIPAISSILQDRSFRPQSEDEKWTMLQALSILYAYRPTVQENTPQYDVMDISHRTIKSFVESYAIHLFVHRSITGLKASIRANQPNITSTKSFKYYMYWLWLFNMSNHSAVVTGTPPSIRIDATIRAAPEVLQTIDIGHNARQILAETELSIHWDKISAHSPALAEWWCPPDTIAHSSAATDIAEMKALDAAIDKALTGWTQKWAIPSEPLGQAMDFHFRFTKFCLSTYLIRDLSIGSQNISNEQHIRLNNSVQAAHYFCQHFQDMGPANRDAARYMGDFGFVMVSFSCLFIIEACKSYRNILQDIDGMLGTVEELATLMKQLAINSSSDQGPNLQANIILRKLQQLDEPDQIAVRPAEALGVQIPFEFVEGEGFMFDPIWDILNFFPEIQ